MHAFDVVCHEVEQIGVDVKVLAGVSVRSGGEELLVGLDRVEEGGQSLALARGGEVVSDRHGLVRYAQSDVRVNAAQFAGEGGVDGFPIVLLAHGPATEGGKPRIVTTAGDAPGKAVNHRHFVYPRSQGFHGHAHGMIIQGPILHLGGVFGKFDSLWLNVARIHPVALYEKEHACRLGRSLARRFKLADERRKIETSQSESGSAKEGASVDHSLCLFFCLKRKESEERSEATRARKLPFPFR